MLLVKKKKTIPPLLGVKRKEVVFGAPKRILVLNFSTVISPNLCNNSHYSSTYIFYNNALGGSTFQRSAVRVK